MVRQIRVFVLYCLYIAQIRFFQERIIQFVDQGIISHCLNPVIRHHGHIFLGGIDDQGIHLHQSEESPGCHCGYMAQAFCVECPNLEIHAGKFHFGEFPRGDAI